MENLTYKTNFLRLTMLVFYMFNGIVFSSLMVFYISSNKDLMQSFIFFIFAIFFIYSWLSGRKLRFEDPINFWFGKAFQTRFMFFYGCSTIYILDGGFDSLYILFSLIVIVLSVICYFIGTVLYDEGLMKKSIKENIKFIDGRLDYENIAPINVAIYSFRKTNNSFIRFFSDSVFKFVFLLIILPLSLLGGGAGYFILGMLRLYLGDSDISPYAIGYFIVCLPTSMYLAFQLPALIHFKRKWKMMYPVKTGE